MKKLILSLFIAVFAVFFGVPLALFSEGIDSQTGLPTIKPPATILVSEKGEVKVTNAVVFMVSGNTFFVRTYWEDAFIRWTIRVNNSTEIIKKFGGTTKPSEIKVGHILNAQGTMVTGADTLNINATVVRDLSLENENGSFSGKVAKVNVGSNSFSLNTASGKMVTVKVEGSANIKKGAIYIPLSKLVMGDKILSVVGTYHQPSETVTATSVEVYQDPSIFIPHNFQGKLKGLSGTNLPATFSLILTSKEYNIVMSEKTEVLTSKRAPAKLQRFVEGDTIRVFGKIRETDLTVVDAEIVRDLDL